MYDLVILTTACSRSKLHTHVLSEIPEFLKGYKCKWIIRIDQINNESVNDTISNFKKILNAEHIDLEIYSSDRTAGRISWFKSVKFCINKGFEYKPKLGYFWLEDDWKKKNNNNLKTILDPLINNITNNSFYISLANRNILNFNPCIWSYDLYEQYMYNKINNEIMPENGGNAERACTYKSGNPEPVDNINIYTQNIFVDEGRAWADINIKGARTFN
jgi:hypothetical protein